MRTITTSLLLLLFIFVFILMHPHDNGATTIRIGVIGDSLAQGWGTDNPPHDKFPMQITIPHHRIVLRDDATGGATVTDMLPYVADLFAFHPDVLVIELGTNDQRKGHSLTQFQSDYIGIYRAFRGIPYILCLSLWPSPGYAATAPYNAIIHSICGSGYIDITSIAIPANETLPENWHPNTHGAALIAGVIATWIKEHT